MYIGYAANFVVVLHLTLVRIIAKLAVRHCSSGTDGLSRARGIYWRGTVPQTV